MKKYKPSELLFAIGYEMEDLPSIVLFTTKEVWEKDENNEKIKETIMKVINKERTSVHKWMDENLDEDIPESEEIQNTFTLLVNRVYTPIEKDEKNEKKSHHGKDLDEAVYSAKAARAGQDIGKPGKAFSKIAADAAERYGSKERGEKVAGAVLAKLRGKNESVEEGMMDTVKTMGKKVAGGINKLVGHGSDEEMRRDIHLTHHLYRSLFREIL